jgi:hypothetical protein
MRNASDMNDKQRCTICLHSQRHTIDQLLAGGGASQRAIANRFHIGRNALARHYERHVLQSVRDQLLRKQERRDQAISETWSARLENTYKLAREGVDRANADPEKWPAAVGFLNVMAKSAETGLRATGEIQAQRPVTINLENIVVMPQVVPSLVPVVVTEAIEVKALAEPDAETSRS